MKLKLLVKRFSPFFLLSFYKWIMNIKYCSEINVQKFILNLIHSEHKFYLVVLVDTANYWCRYIHYEKYINLKNILIMYNKYVLLLEYNKIDMCNTNENIFFFCN